MLLHKHDKEDTDKFIKKRYLQIVSPFLGLTRKLGAGYTAAEFTVFANHFHTRLDLFYQDTQSC